MTLPDSSAFHHGKEARKNNLPCILGDGRLKAETRADWYAGWNHQDRLMAPPLTADQINAFNGFLSDLAKECRQSLKNS
jgi:hypothetical protein